jgi:NitT/TauT family transport system substrate-binding protein
MKKALCVMVVIGFLLVGSLPVAAETYTLGFLPFIGWAEYKVAEAKGFWEKQGITVKLVEYDLPLEAMRGVLNRRFDFMPTPLAAIVTPLNEGVVNSVYLGTLSIADHHKYLIIKNDLVNKSLKGHKIGIFLSDPSNNFLLSTYLKTVNTDLADVRLVEMSTKDLETNFRHNRLQVVLAIDRGNPFYEQADGVVAISTRDFYEPHGLFLVRQGGTAAIPPEDLKKILRGCVDAIEWIRDPVNWEEYKAILKQHFLAGMPDLSDEQIRAFTKEGKFFEPQILLEHNQQRLRDHFTQLRAFVVADGSLKADVLDAFTYNNVIYNQPLIEVLQEYGQ